MAQSFDEQLASVTGKIHGVDFCDDFERYRAGLLYYWNKAEKLHEAAELVWTGLLLQPIAIMLTGMSMELLLKGIYVAFDMTVPQSHKLGDLCAELGIKISAVDQQILSAISEHIIWAARYTTPKTAKQMFAASELFDQRMRENEPDGHLIVKREQCDRLWEVIACLYHKAQEVRPESVRCFERDGE
jgi:hypothetical protein